MVRFRLSMPFFAERVKKSGTGQVRTLELQRGTPRDIGPKGRHRTPNKRPSGLPRGHGDTRTVPWRFALGRFSCPDIPEISAPTVDEAAPVLQNMAANSSMAVSSKDREETE